MTEQLIGQLGYLGITLILILGGLGLPIPEEAPIILAAVLTRNGQMHGPLALASCLAGVLLGDMVVYLLGFFYGEKVLSLPLTRRLLTRQREAQIKGYFHRHGFKILVSGRLVPGFRTAAYLTAGILKLPPLKLLVTDAVAASLSTFLMFGLAYAFADQIQSGIREVQQWVTLIVALGVASWLVVRYEKARRRSGLPVGPPVLDSDDVPLPPSDHHPGLPVSPPVLDSDDVPLPPGDRHGPSMTPETAVRSEHEPAVDRAESERTPECEPPAAARPGPVESAPQPATTPQARRPRDAVTIELDAGQPSSSIESPSR